MATRRSKTRLDVLRGTPPGELTALDLDLVIAEADRKIALMQALAESDAWRLLCRVREQRKKNLGRQLEGLVKRLAQPLEGQPPGPTAQPHHRRGGRGGGRGPGGGRKATDPMGSQRTGLTAGRARGASGATRRWPTPTGSCGRRSRRARAGRRGRGPGPG